MKKPLVKKICTTLEVPDVPEKDIGWITKRNNDRKREILESPIILTDLDIINNASKPFKIKDERLLTYECF